VLGANFCPRLSAQGRNNFKITDFKLELYFRSSTATRLVQTKKCPIILKHKIATPEFFFFLISWQKKSVTGAAVVHW
jgi:hypothetical protein